MYIKTLLNINKSGTIITEELIPQRYNTVSKIKISQPEETGVNSTTTAKLNTVAVEPNEKPTEKEVKKETIKQFVY